MGRQIGFYMMPEDEKKFVKFLKSDCNAKIYPTTISKLPAKQLSLLPQYGTDFGYSVWIHNPNINIQIKYDYIKEQRYYYINSTKSYVIQSSRCGPKDNLKEGRLWTEIIYWSKDKSGKNIIVRRPIEFVKWFNKITNWIRRNYENYGGLYFSPRVVQYLKEGGKISVSGHKVGWDVIQKWKEE